MLESSVLPFGGMLFWVSLSVLCLILGGIISISNWYYAIKWMCKKYKNRRASNIDGTIPLLGGLFIMWGFIFLGVATESPRLYYSAPILGIIIDFWTGAQWFVYPVFFKLLENTKGKRTRKNYKSESLP